MLYFHAGFRLIIIVIFIIWRTIDAAVAILLSFVLVLYFKKKILKLI